MGFYKKSFFAPIYPIFSSRKSVFIKMYVLACSAQVASLIIPVSAQIVFDRIILHQNFSTLALLSLVAGIALIFEGLLASLSVRIFSKTACQIKAAIDVEQVRAILGQPLAVFEIKGTGAFIGKLQEIDDFIDYISSYAFIHALSALSFVAIYLAVMALYSAKLTLIFLLAVPIICLYLKYAARKTYAFFEKRYKAKSAVLSSLIETIRGIGVVKSVCMESYRFELWRKYAEKNLKIFYQTNHVHGRLFHSFDLIGKVLLLALLLFGAKEVVQNEMTMGALIAFYMLSSRIFDPVFQVAEMWIRLQKHAVTLQDLSRLLVSNKEISVETNRAEAIISEEINAIEFERVSFCYDQEVKRSALNDVSLTLHKGLFYGLIGETGSGKSTLIKLLHRHYQPDSGVIRINGESIALQDLRLLRAEIGFVPQEPLLFSGSILENIVLGREISHEYVHHIAQVLGSHNFIDNLRDGYETVLNEGGGGLSGGQKQQICLMRALVGRPKVLLLDEPTSAMDYRTEARIMRGIAECSKNTTILMISHRLSVLEAADQIFLLSDGRIVDAGPYNELISRLEYVDQQSEFADDSASFSVG